MIHSLLANSKMTRPLSDCFSLSAPSQKHVFSCVVRLCVGIYESAVRRRITPVVVPSIYLHSMPDAIGGSPLIECSAALAPFLANLYTSAAIVRPPFVSWVVAAVQHVAVQVLEFLRA